jgi:hypothetical protein
MLFNTIDACVATESCLLWRRSTPTEQRTACRLTTETRPDAILESVLAFEMIYDFINDFQVDLFERPKRLGNLAFSIHLDQYLPLARSGFWCRKELNQKRNVTSRSLLEQKSGLAKAPIYVESI